MTSRHVYKYSDFGINQISSILTPSIHFSRLNTLNDPFEYQFLYEPSYSTTPRVYFSPALRDIHSANMSKAEVSGFAQKPLQIRIRRLYDWLIQDKHHDMIAAAANLDESDEEQQFPHYYVQEDDVRELHKIVHGLEHIVEACDGLDADLEQVAQNDPDAISSINIASRFLAFCLSKNPKNLLLWSHYARNHRGLALEYSADILENDTLCSIPAYGAHDFSWHGKLVPVSYRKDRPSGDDTFPSIVNRLLTKSQNWSYEEEERCLVMEYGCKHVMDPKKLVETPNGYNYRIAPEALVGVIMGAEMTDANKRIIELIARNLGSNRSLRIKQARLSEDEFSVIIE